MGAYVLGFKFGATGGHSDLGRSCFAPPLSLSNCQAAVNSARPPNLSGGPGAASVLLPLVDTSTFLPMISHYTYMKVYTEVHWILATLSSLAVSMGTK